MSVTALLSNTSGLTDVTGDPVRGSAYMQSVGGTYTVAIYAVNLTGQVIIEGSLVTQPQSTDWFAITPDGFSTPYVAFPYSGPSTSSGGVQVVGVSFKGNFTWIRARLSRDYLGTVDNSQNQFGFIESVLLNGSAIDPTATIVPALPSLSAVTSVNSQTLGNGASIVSSLVGTENVMLNLRSIMQGNGITITEDTSSITISADLVQANGVTSFVQLSDAPKTITNAAVLVGQQSSLAFTNAATANSVLLYDGSRFQWAQPSAIGGLIGNSANTEWACLQYTSGSFGNFNSVDAIVSNSVNVTPSLVDPVNCVVQFTFTNHGFPPTSIAMLGQVQQTNDFIYSNMSTAIATRKIAGGGTASAPTLLGQFAGPVTLQLRMSDTGASANAGQRAQVIVLFKF